MRRMSLFVLAVVSSAWVFAADLRPEVALSRIDCGRFQLLDMASYDDTVFDGERRDAVNVCYVIRHGRDFMIWETGMSVGFSLSGGGAKAIGPKRSVKDILADQGINPEQVKFLGVSHNHYDHLGQAADFPHAKLLIGAEDWVTLKNLAKSEPNNGFQPSKSLQPWLDDETKVQQVTGDKDVFGDGSVVMLDTPGHTAGHHSILVRLKDKGAILLTGDLYEWRQNFESDAVPRYEDNRADKLASYDRFKKIARNLEATVIIQHEPADAAKLPAFPDWAE